MRREDQAGGLEVRHDVADRRGRQRHRQDAGEIARADRLAGRQVAVDDLAEDLARTVVQLRDGAGFRAHAKRGRLAVRRRYRALTIASAPAIMCGRPPLGECACGSRARASEGRHSARGESAMRPSKRAPDEMRTVTLERGVARYAEGSCLVSFGDTHVLCTASLEERPPPWLRGSGKGWVTAEYAMLPRATHERTRREVNSGKPSGRTQEIQRLIGRSPARRGQPAGDRRAADHGGLRRDPGRRRHAHRRPSRAPGWRCTIASSGCSRARSSRSTPARTRGGRVLRHLPGRSPCSTSTTPRIPSPKPTRISS